MTNEDWTLLAFLTAVIFGPMLIVAIFEPIRPVTSDKTELTEEPKRTKE